VGSAGGDRVGPLSPLTPLEATLTEFRPVTPLGATLTSHSRRVGGLGGSTLEVRGSINPAVGKMQVRSNLQLLTSFRCYRPGTSLTNQTRSIPDTMSEWPARSAEGQNSAVLIPREPSPPARPLATLRSVVLTRNPKLSTFLTPLRAFQSLPAFLWREKLPVGSLRAHPASGIPAGKGLEWTESPRTEESCPTPTRSVLPEQDLERSENNQLDHTPGFSGGISL